MDLFIYITFLSLMSISFLGMFWLYKKISFDHFYYLGIKSFLRNFKNNEYFCSFAIAQCVKIALKEKDKKNIIELALGRVEGPLALLEKKKIDNLKLAFLAFKNPNTALPSFEKIMKENPQNMFILGELADLYLQDENFEKLYLSINNFDEKNASKYTKAKFLYLEAAYDLRYGNMLSVSDKLEKAAKLFRSEKALVEEAKCYMLMGITYKASGIFDVAQFTFETALLIYKKLDYAIGMYEAYGNLGTLMSVQKRFEEAEGYFEKALDLNIPQKNKAYILNQKALNNLLQNKYDLAEEFLNTALENSHSSQDDKAKALAFEIMSYLKFEMNNYPDAIDYAKKSEEIYKKINNISAFLETKYARALAHFEIGEIDRSEKLARDILDIYPNEINSFHLANCYNLLGLILLRKGEYRHAKGLFKESVNLEQKNDRIKEIATDYFNISLAEVKMGDKKQSDKTLEIALAYAEEANEDELAAIIRHKLKKIN